MNVETLNVADLHPDPANVRRHPERNLAAIRASLARFGQVKPIVVDASNVIRAGNGTYEAARQLGWETILAVRTGLSGTEATAYAIADNRTAEIAEWDDVALAEQLRALQSEDFDLDAVGYTAEEVDALLEQLGSDLLGGEGVEAPKPQIDQAEELLAKWKVEPGQLWVIPSKATPGGEHRLLCGDSTKAEHVARVMRGDRFVLVATDPPYGVDFKRGQYLSDPSRKAKTSAPASIVGDDRKGDEQRAFVAEVFRVLSSHADGAASVYMFSACLVEGCCSYFGLLDAGVKVQSQLIWVKNVHCLGQADHHWKHEICWYGWFDSGPHHWYGERDKTTLLECARVASTLHPNEKPVPLVAGMIENSSRPGEIVAEPFSGSGTTAAACESTGRLCRAIELDPKFVAVALQRLADMGLEPSVQAPN